VVIRPSHLGRLDSGYQWIINGVQLLVRSWRVMGAMTASSNAIVAFNERTDIGMGAMTFFYDREAPQSGGLRPGKRARPIPGRARRPPGRMMQPIRFRRDPRATPHTDNVPKGPPEGRRAAPIWRESGDARRPRRSRLLSARDAATSAPRRPNRASTVGTRWSC
jgi:hypothetical protein